MSWFHRKKTGNEPALPLLSTERLVLRCFAPNDAVDVYAYAQSEQVGPMAGWAPHKSLEDSRKVVENFIETGEVWAIVEKRTGHVIGSIGLHRDGSRRIEGARQLGYALGEASWGQGYATEACREMLRYAFEELNCPVVSASHFPFNQKIKRVIRKLGFTYEGVLRHVVILPDGQPADKACYSLLKSEYENQLKTR